MAIWDDLWNYLESLYKVPGSAKQGTEVGTPPSGIWNPTGSSTPIGTPEANKPPNAFLTKTALVIGAVAAAPVLYTIYNQYQPKRKRRTDLSQDPMFMSLEGASNRATSLLAGILPAFAFPIAYIGIEELEERKIISGPLGDDVQALMTAGVVAPAIGNIIGSVIGAYSGGMAKTKVPK